MTLSDLFSAVQAINVLPEALDGYELTQDPEYRDCPSCAPSDSTDVVAIKAYDAIRAAWLAEMAALRARRLREHLAALSDAALLRTVDALHGFVDAVRRTKLAGFEKQ